MRPVLSCSSLTKRYPTTSGHIEALADFDLELDPGHSLTVIGPNGAGKSTLLRLVAGISAPSSGTIRRGRRTAGLIELGAGFEPELTGRENLEIALALLGFAGRQRRRIGADVTEFSELGDAMRRPVKQFSTGMVARLALAAALFSDPDLLLVDEVLTVGDASFQRRSLSRIRSMVDEGCALVLVTHQMALARSIADEVLWLDAGRERLRGVPQKVVAEYERHYSLPTAAQHQNHTQITQVIIEPNRIQPGGSCHVRASLATRRRGLQIAARVELRAPVGDDDHWMISRREPHQNIALNVIGRTASHPMVTPDSDTAELELILPTVPVTTSSIDLVVVVMDDDGKLLDELGVPLRIGDPADAAMPKLLIGVDGPLPDAVQPQ